MPQKPINPASLPDFIVKVYPDKIDSQGNQLTEVQCPYCGYQDSIYQSSYQPDPEMEPHRKLMKDHLAICGEKPH